MSTIETQVTERIAREREQLTHRHSALNAEHGEAITHADDALEHLTTRGREAYSATEPDMDDLKAAFAAAERAVKRAIGTGKKVWDVAHKLEALDADGEVERRVEEAKALEETRASGRRLSAKTLAIAALIRKGSAMHYRDITKAILESGLITLKGSTPEATVNAMLAVAAKKGDTFDKVAPGVFDLIDREASEDGDDVRVAPVPESTALAKARANYDAAHGIDPTAPPEPETAPEAPEPATKPKTAPERDPRLDAEPLDVSAGHRSREAKAKKATAKKGGGTGSNQNEAKRDRAAAARKAAATRKAKREAEAAAADNQKASA